MTEIWWKVLVFGLAIAGALKLVGVSISFPILVLLSSVSVLVFFIVAMAVHNFRVGRKRSE